MIGLSAWCQLLASSMCINSGNVTWSILVLLLMVLFSTYGSPLGILRDCYCIRSSIDSQTHAAPHKRSYGT